MTDEPTELLPPVCKYCGQPKAIHSEFTMSCPIVPRYQPKHSPSPISRNAVIRECARIARDGCLVPPDGGSPTEAEAVLCDHISAQILALIEQEG
jgi:hypothetical protein